VSRWIFLNDQTVAKTQEAEQVTPAGNVETAKKDVVVDTTPLQGGGKLEETKEKAAVGVTTPQGAEVGKVEQVKEETAKVTDAEGNVVGEAKKEEVKAA
jgi:hypothetical protein